MNCDVLAVMDAVEGWAREVSDEFIDGSDFRTEYARDLRDFREARAAVAELIAAAREAADDCPELMAYGERIHAALIRCGVSP